MSGFLSRQVITRKCKCQQSSDNSKFSEKKNRSGGMMPSAGGQECLRWELKEASPRQPALWGEAFQVGGATDAEGLGQMHIQSWRAGPR